jgi:hypothetical protein
MDEKYKGLPKVVAVLDGYRFVINRGSENGVKAGANYLVFGLGGMLKDPDTSDDLGQLELVRGRAKVIHLQEKMATLESTEKTYVPGKVRKIKRDLFSLTGQTEEIEEGAETYKAEIEARPGDFARPI